MKSKYNIVTKCISLIIIASAALTISGCKTEEDSKKTNASAETKVSENSQKTESSITTSSATESSEENNSKIPKEWQDEGIFSDYYDKAYDKMKKMSLYEKVGQMLMVRCPEADADEIAKDYHLGGYVLFGRDFIGKTKDEVIDNNNTYIKSPEIPMVISVDEEGGTVSRISGNKRLTDQDFKSPRELFDEGGMEAIEADALRKAQLLSDLKINVNLAPVCDISTGTSNYMYDRSLGQNAEVTSIFAASVTKISQENGVSATLKHFPGYGNNTDTHTGIAVDKRTYETFLNNDFKPFESGINAGAHMVLVSHNVVECMDKENPASLSEKVHKILREKLKFSGIIITDDLSMDAISKSSDGTSAEVRAVLAGNDMLCVTEYDNAYNNIIDAVHTGKLETDLIDRAVMRILAWKYAKGMIK